MSPNLIIALTMCIYGTIGVFRRLVPFPSQLVALLRGVIGFIVLLLYKKLRHRRFDLASIKPSLLPLCISGVCLGLNWVLLFEAYNYTSVAVATLCYYFAPTFMILASPILLKEKLNARKLICVAVSLLGIAFVSGVLESGFELSEMKGVLLGIAAALLYAGIVYTNKLIKNVDPIDRTALQLTTSSIALLPYVLLVCRGTELEFSPLSIIIMLVMGVVHTGIAYALYFSALPKVKMQTAALLSYIDPVLAVFLSALLLKEPMTIWQGIGAVLILGSAIVSEITPKGRE